MCNCSCTDGRRANQAPPPPRKARMDARRLMANHGTMAMQAACDLYDAALAEGDLVEAEHWEDVKVAMGLEES